MAHTFTSTSPIGSTTSRTVSSVMSVGTFDAFLGQATQIEPASVERPQDRRQPLLEHRPLGLERDDQIEVALRPAADGDVVGQPDEQVVEPVGRAEQRDDHARP